MKRVLLKLSGDCSIAGDKKTGFDEATCIGVAKQVKQLVDDGMQVGDRYQEAETSGEDVPARHIDRTKADQIGMLATVMNCIYVSEIFRAVGMKTADVYAVCMWRIYEAVFQGSVLKACFAEKVRSHSLQVVPDIRISQRIQRLFFVPSRSRQRRDSCLQKRLMVFMTVIRRTNPEAKKYDEISIQEVIDQKLAVVDLTASILCHGE